MKTVFIDRYDAGRQLAEKISEYKDTDSVVLALPYGGTLVGHEIASILNLPFDIVITRKIEHPFNRGLAICAIAENGKPVCGDYGFCGIDRAWIHHESASALREIAHKRRMFGIRQHVSIKNKTVIVTDDGIDTGLTMKAALLTIESHKPKKIVLAVPVCPREVLKELKSHVDEVVVLDDGEGYRGTIGAYYKHFPEVYDKEVIVCLRMASQVGKNMAEPQYV